MNLRLAEIFRLLADVTGLPAPRVRIPYAVAWMAAAGMEGASRLTRRAPRVSLTAVRMARKRMFFSAAKAVRDWGCRRPTCARPCAMPWTGSTSTATGARARRWRAGQVDVHTSSSASIRASR